MLLQWEILLVWNAFNVKSFEWRVLLEMARVYKTYKKWALTNHNKFTGYYYTRTRWLAINELCKPIVQHVFCATEGMNAKIRFSMKFIYFIVFNCLHVSCYIFVCNFVKDMDFAGLSNANDNATYENVVSEREFVIIIFSTHWIKTSRGRKEQSLFFFVFRGVNR